MANGLILTYQAGGYGRYFGGRLLADLYQHLATVLGLLIGIAFVLTVNDAFFERSTFSANDFHLACAGIMGTALALVLSLSIVPAQKAADFFSSAILQLYAQDRVLWSVFAWLASLTLASVLLGTDWTFGLDPRWTIALQFVLLGIALDQVRVFYLRALELLNPQTALGLVREHCNQLLKAMARNAKRLTRIFKVAGGKHGALGPSAAQWLSFKSSPASQRLIGWMHQLEEFAHKALARRDTQAANSALATMAAIGIHYSEVRRDSIVLEPEFAGYMPVGVSDATGVLNPIYESIKNVCQDAARQPSEAVVATCIRELGRMAAHAMTIVHTQSNLWKTAPLAHSPIFYLDVCAKEAAKAQMDDALLAAVRAFGPVFQRIKGDVRTLEAEATAIDCLLHVALASYVRRSVPPANEAVQMMLTAARQELKVRDYSYNNNLKTILNNIAYLVPFEVQMEKAGLRLMQFFAPYSAHLGLRNLLIEEVEKIKPDERDWVDPFHDFNELSEDLVHHYRKIGDEVNFGGVLLERWVVESALDCADVHMYLLEKPAAGSEGWLDKVEHRLTWFIHTPSRFFKETPSHNAEDAAARLSIIGMRLLRLNRPEGTTQCAKAIWSMGHTAAGLAKAKPYYVADILVKLDQLAKAADALGYTGLAQKIRATDRRDEIEAKLPGYTKAILGRIEYLDEILAEHPSRDRFLPHDPVPLLREILSQRTAASG